MIRMQTQTRLSRRTQRLLFAGILLMSLGANVLFTYSVFTAHALAVLDFFSRWEGAHAFWRDGLSPYSAQVGLSIQQRVYGRPAVAGQDFLLFAYPFYTVFIIWPLVYLPYAWASAIWMVLLEVCLIVMLSLLLDLFQWRPPPWLWFLLVLGMLANYYATSGVFLGQPGQVVCLLEVLTIWALVRAKDDRAGFALALSTLKPQMGFLLVPFLLLWGLRYRRWRFLGAFGAVLGGLVGLSFLLEPDWLASWLEQVHQYSAYTASLFEAQGASDPLAGSPIWLLTQHYLRLGSGAEWALTLLCSGALLWAWYAVLIPKRTERWLWTVALTLAVTHLVAWRTTPSHFIIFALPLIFYLREITRQHSAWAVPVLLAGLVVPWLHALVAAAGRAEQASALLPAPLGVLAVLWFTRRLWWRADSLLAPPIHSSAASQYATSNTG